MIKKKIWNVFEERIANAKDSNKPNCPWKLKIDNKIKISEDEIANAFNKLCRYWPVSGKNYS